MNSTTIYIRTSTEEQTPELQLKGCEAVALKLNLNDYEIVSDKQSAWKDNVERDGFNKITQAIKRKEVKTLICWDLDRLYRKRKKLVEFFEYCKFYDCKIYSVRQDWLENLNKIQPPFNEIMFNLMLQVMGWMAEEESSRKSMRVKNAVVRENGKKTVSYKGKVWGRKSLNNNVIDEILKLHETGLSIREIANSVFYVDKNRNKKRVSKSIVHKIISKNHTKPLLVLSGVH